MINLGIVGGRDYTNYDKFKEIVDAYINEIGRPNIIVSGGAKGVDTMAEKYSLEYNIPIAIFSPEWDKYGKKAGIIRNTDIVKNSTHILALPTEQSKGTYDTIRKTEKLGKILRVIYV